MTVSDLKIMKTFQLHILLPIVLFTVVALQATAQERVMPAVVVGVNSGYTPLSLVLAVNNDISSYQANASMAWGGLTLIFPKLFAHGFGLSTTVGYASYTLSGAGVVTRSLLDGARSVNGLVNVTTDYVMPAGQIDLLFYGQFGDIMRFEFGPWGGIGFVPTYQSLEEVVLPSTATFADGSQQRFESGQDVNSFVLNLGATLRISAEIPLPGGLALLPSASAQAAAVMADADQANGVVGLIGVGMGLLFNGTNGDRIESLEPIVPLSDTGIRALPASRLRASIDLFSQSGDGRRIDTLLLMVRRTLHHVEAPLMTSIRFEKNSAALPAHYVRYTVETRDLFSLDSLVGGDVAGLYGQMLNVIGSRLAIDRKIRVTLNGLAAKDEPVWFARSRAEAIRDYLISVWNVDASQVVVKAPRTKAGAQGTGDLRGVEIDAQDERLLDPVVVEWIEQEIDGTPIGLEPSISADSGVRGWRVTVMRGGRELAVVRSTDDRASSLLDVAALLSDVDPDREPGELEAELVVEDSTGATRIARDRMAIRIPSREEMNAEAVVDDVDHVFSRYIMFDLTPTRMRRSIQRIAASIHEGAVVSLSPAAGSADRRPELQRKLTEFSEQLADACRRQGVRLADLRIRDGAGNSNETLPRINHEITPIEITVSQNYHP